MDIQQKTEEVEKELLDIIILHLQNRQIDMNTASKLARDFIAVLPIQNRQDLLLKLQNLGNSYKEAKAVYQQELAKDVVQKEQQALIQMQGAIRQGNIDHAINVAKSLQNNL